MTSSRSLYNSPESHNFYWHQQGSVNRWHRYISKWTCCFNKCKDCKHNILLLFISNIHNPIFLKPISNEDFYIQLAVDATLGQSTTSHGFGVFIVDSNSIETNDPLTQPYGINWSSFTGLGFINQYSTGSFFGINSGTFNCLDPAILPSEPCGSAGFYQSIRATLIGNTLTVNGFNETDQVSYVFKQPLGIPLNIGGGSSKYLVIAGFSDVGNADKLAFRFINLNYPTVSCSPACSSPKVCISNTCQCSQGWSGVNCDVASCSQTCQNGGSCSYPNFCQCTDSWGGSDCTKS